MRITRSYLPSFANADQAEHFVSKYSYWYQRIDLGHGVTTMEIGPAFHEMVWDRLKLAFPRDLKGASALDIGTNAGYFPIQLKRLGAGKIVGLEFEPEFLSQANEIKKIYGLDNVTYKNIDAHELVQFNESFDITVFTGIFYHLKNPLQVIEDVGRLTTDAVLLEGEVIVPNQDNGVYARLGYPPSVSWCSSGLMKFTGGGQLNNDKTNWWTMDTDCLIQMLKISGFCYFSKPVYLNESRLVMIATKQKKSLLDISKFV